MNTRSIPGVRAPMAKKTAAGRNSFLYPLDEFYSAAGTSLPSVKRLDGARIPQPYRELLVHDGDMTPALEKHHGHRIHLRLLDKRAARNAYLRQVVLVLNGTEKPVEFGAIRINLEFFSARARADILRGERPLGTIMEEHAIPHSSRPSGFFSVKPDALITAALALSGPTLLYGRRNTLLTPDGKALAEIVEILSR